MHKGIDRLDGSVAEINGLTEFECLAGTSKALFFHSLSLSFSFHIFLYHVKRRQFRVTYSPCSSDHDKSSWFPGRQERSSLRLRIQPWWRRRGGGGGGNDGNRSLALLGPTDQSAHRGTTFVLPWTEYLDRTETRTRLEVKMPDEQVGGGFVCSWMDSVGQSIGSGLCQR